MTFADSTQAQDEPAPSLGCAGLVGVPDDARIEQGRGFERILVKKVGTDQVALRFAQHGMRLQGTFHLNRARIEDLEQVPVAALEIVEHVLQLLIGSVLIEPQHSADDMIGARLVGRVEIPGLDRRLERPHEDPGRIGAQMQSLSVQEHGLRQRGSLDVRCAPAQVRR